jgi:PAS domain-containing protein
VGEASRGQPGALSAVEAGEILGLPPDVVRALADAGYLTPSTMRGGVPRFALGDLKAFQARAGESDVLAVDDLLEVFEPDAVLPLLDARADDIAQRTFDLLGAVLPEVLDFTAEQRQRFIDEAGERIRAILAVCAHGPRTDWDLEQDLAEIGADAAHRGVPLPGVLIVLRTARDLVVQTAVELAEERGRQWGLALSVALTRVLPAIDRLSDAVARGYWDALLEIEVEGIDRFRNMADRVVDGVFALDVDGVVSYVNSAFVAVLGLDAAAVVGRHVADVLGIEAGADAETDRFAVRQVERLRDGVVVGWDGIVRPGEGGLDGGEHPRAAAGVVDQGDRLGHDALGDGAERVGGRAAVEHGGGPSVAAEGDGGFEGHLPE